MTTRQCRTSPSVATPERTEGQPMHQAGQSHPSHDAHPRHHHGHGRRPGTTPAGGGTSPHRPSRAVFLDIGEHTGALVLRAPAEREGLEVEIHPASDPSQRTHVWVLPGRAGTARFTRPCSRACPPATTRYWRPMARSPRPSLSPQSGDERHLGISANRPVPLTVMTRPPGRANQLPEFPDAPCLFPRRAGQDGGMGHARLSHHRACQHDRRMGRGRLRPWRPDRRRTAVAAADGQAADQRAGGPRRVPQSSPASSCPRQDAEAGRGRTSCPSPPSRLIAVAPGTGSNCRPSALRADRRRPYSAGKMPPPQISCPIAIVWQQLSRGN